MAFVVSLFALAKALHLQYEWFLGPADVFPEEGADELPEGQAELLPLRHQKCGHQDQQMLRVEAGQVLHPLGGSVLGIPQYGSSCLWKSVKKSRTVSFSRYSVCSRSCAAAKCTHVYSKLVSMVLRNYVAAELRIWE